MSKTLDRDLKALQQVRDLLRKARAAADVFRTFDPEDSKRIAGQVARTLEPKARFYAEWAVKETGFGRVEDKISKNIIGTTGIFEAYSDVQLGGLRRDDTRRVVEVARPAGVIVGLSNSTSPVATIFFKTIMALMTRNAIVFSPHPAALECSRHAAEAMMAAARNAGAPDDCIQIASDPTVEATNAMMRANETDLILATGGGAMVRAAYSSGNPTIGVGPGNTPVYVDRSADIRTAAKLIMTGKEFDYGTPCSAPSVVLADQPIAMDLRAAFEAEGAFFCTPEEQVKLEAHAFPNNRLNPAIVGRPATMIAEQAGVAVPSTTRALIGALGDPQSSPPMAKEKLSTIMGAKVVNGVDEAIGVARAMLKSAGAGHTAGIWTADAEQAVFYGAALDYYRVVVNGDTTMGSTGTDTGLPTTFTIGTGYAGKSSTDMNVGPEQLIDWKRIAFPLPGGLAALSSEERSGGPSDAALRNDIRRIVAEELAKG